MDALLGSRGWKWHATDWAAAAVSGFAAGAVLMVLDLLWSTIFNPDGPWRTSHMIAPIFSSADGLRSAPYHFSVAVVSIALATHYALGIVFGVVLGAVMAQFRLDTTPGRAALSGAILGSLLYLLNFGLLVQFFPWLVDLRGWDTHVAHVVFGIVAAVLYWRLKRTPSEP